MTSPILSSDTSTRKRKRSKFAGRPSPGNDSSQKKACVAEKNPVKSKGDNSDGQTTTIVHESLKQNHTGKHKSGAKCNYAPEDETSEQRDARTIFIRNLPIEVAQKKVRVLMLWLPSLYMQCMQSSLKRLHRHIFALVPS